jgi:glycerol-3-phosphate dehydrogenase (NAD(P)+)
MRSIGVLGAGSFGTALAIHATTVAGEVVLWARRDELARRIAARRVNDDYLPEVEIPTGVRLTSDPAELTGCEAVIVAVPSHGFREALRGYLATHPAGRPAVVVSATKGIEVESLARMSQVAREEGESAGRVVRFAVLSGPSFAEELARGLPTLVVAASADEELATTLREELASPSLRLYSSSDVAGVELAGTAKNVIAIAAGVVAGLGLGHNTLAALITRGLAEITRLGIAYGGRPETFSGLAGLGDLVLTCTGGLSRNRRIGVELAGGRAVAEVTGDTRMVAEGVRNSLAVKRLADRRGIEMPISQQMVALLYEGKQARRAVEELMTRDLKPETETPR